MRERYRTLLISIVVILVIVTVDAWAASLSWTAPTTNADGTVLTDLASYRIYAGTAPGVYGTPVAIGLTTSYPLTGLTPGQRYYLAVTAIDTSGNQSVFSNEVSYLAPASTCPCSLWSPSDLPGMAASTDTKPVELGVKFQASVAGFITGIRFYKGPGNTGVHTGSLWNAAGTRLATAAFTGETATGWQQVMLPTPMAIQVNTTYIASYFASVGRWSATAQGLTQARVVGPLTALASGSSGGNGVFWYAPAGGFPRQTSNAQNYFVDVVFEADLGSVPTPTSGGNLQINP